MNEFFPFAAGCVLGGVLTRLSSRPRAMVLPVACLIAGALASAANGELSSGYWAIFVSLDSLLVWLGAAVSTAVFWSWMRLRSGGPAARP